MDPSHPNHGSFRSTEMRSFSVIVRYIVYRFYDVQSAVSQPIKYLCARLLRRLSNDTSLRVVLLSFIFARCAYFALCMRMHAYLFSLAARILHYAYKRMQQVLDGLYLRRRYFIFNVSSSRLSIYCCVDLL